MMANSKSKKNQNIEMSSKIPPFSSLTSLRIMTYFFFLSSGT